MRGTNSAFPTARPVQAALTSASTFAVGAALPLSMVLLMPRPALVAGVSIASFVFLGLLGAIGARAGGANVARPPCASPSGARWRWR